MKRQVVKVSLKNGFVFDGRKIYVQSMLNEASENLDANVEQAKQLEKAGCDILRVALPNLDSVKLIKLIKNDVQIPLVGDVHFDYRIAIAAVEAGIDKIRINPGNLGSSSEIKKIVLVCKKEKVPIRIGINAGSLEKEVLSKNFNSQADAMVYSALKNVKILEQFDFNDIVVSMKSSNVAQTIKAYKKFRQKSFYPLHLGVTEAGLRKSSLIKSAVGIGALLVDGIGETLRVSVTGDPVQEVEIGHLILRCLNLEKCGVEIIACPTCGRTKINVVRIAEQVEKKTYSVKSKIKVAVMGCVVNGPGEAKHADLAIAGGDGCAVLFKNGCVCGKVDEVDIVNVLVDEIFKLDKTR